MYIYIVGLYMHFSWEPFKATEIIVILAPANCHVYEWVNLKREHHICIQEKKPHNPYKFCKPLLEICGERNILSICTTANQKTTNNAFQLVFYSLIVFFCYLTYIKKLKKFYQSLNIVYTYTNLYICKSAINRSLHSVQ